MAIVYKMKLLIVNMYYVHRTITMMFLFILNNKIYVNVPCYISLNSRPLVSSSHNVSFLTVSNDTRPAQLACSPSDQKHKRTLVSNRRDWTRRGRNTIIVRQWTGAETFYMSTLYIRTNTQHIYIQTYTHII